MIELIIYIILFLIFFKFLIFHYFQNRILYKIPGPFPWPFVGNIFYIKSAANFMNILPNEITYYKSQLIAYTIGLHVDVIVVGEEALREVLKSQDLISKGFVYDWLSEWLGYGLLTSKGDNWKQQRRLLTPAFHFKILDNYIHVAHEEINIFINLLRQTNGKYVDIVKYVTNCTLDVIAKTAMGVELGAQTKENLEYVKCIAIFGNEINARYFSLFGSTFLWQYTSISKQSKKAVQYLHNFTEKVIKERKQLLLKKEKITTETKEHVDFLDILLTTKYEDNTPLSDLDIRSQVDTFMFEGHDTTAHGIIWTLYELSKNKKIQEKLRQEVNKCFGSSNYSPETLKSCEYLQRVINESHRLHPPVPSFCKDS